MTDIAAALEVTVRGSSPRFQHANDVFTRADGTAYPVTGACQLVFCDLGTPAANRWNVYDALRDRLVEHGLPRDGVRFIHDAHTDAAKAALFEPRGGEVAVLIGSTEKMGVGTNAQTRAVALHHLDCPWRPCDLHHFIPR